MTPHDRFRLAILEFGVEEACLWFGYKRGDPFIREVKDDLDKYLKEQTEIILGNRP